MELSINLEYLKKRADGTTRSFGDALNAAVNAGFKYFDYTSTIKSPDFYDIVTRERALIDSVGGKVEQSHAPFNRYNQHGDEFAKYFHRSFESAVALGAEYIVVHADEYHAYDRFDMKEIVEFTYNYIAPELEFAKKHGLKVAIENLFEDLPRGYQYVDGKSRFTSRIEELVAIIERFNDPDVVCCWDFGHAGVSFGYDKMLDQLKQVGKYLRCTHVHDNGDRHDSHEMPFHGKIDWKSHMEYLCSIGYGKDNDCKLSFEFVYYPMPEDVFPAWLAYTKSVGDSLVKMYEN